jgi:uncharacterized protein involved in type VI secretion and phage assembly
MINGLVVGIVLDNEDPNKMNRVMVKYPVDSEKKVKSSWCRMCVPMAGKGRGMVMLPDIGTEVVLAFAYRSMSPYVLGAVYNGQSDRTPYKNADIFNTKRVFWSRNSHAVIFDDTAGAEKVEIGAKANRRLDVTSGPIYQSADAVEKTLTTHSEKHIIIEAVETISIKCKDFKLETDKTIAMEAGSEGVFQSGSSTEVKASSTAEFSAGKVDLNPPGPAASAESAMPTPEHRHPPKK